jgi:hypothetical protein
MKVTKDHFVKIFFKFFQVEGEFLCTDWLETDKKISTKAVLFKAQNKISLVFYIKNKMLTYSI